MARSVAEGFGLAPEPVIGPCFARTGWPCPGMSAAHVAGRYLGKPDKWASGDL